MLRFYLVRFHNWRTALCSFPLDMLQTIFLADTKHATINLKSHKFYLWQEFLHEFDLVRIVLIQSEITRC